MGKYLPDLQFQPYVSSYVGNANKELADTRDILKDTYTKNLAEADAVDLAFRQLPVVKGDILHKEKAGEAIKSVFNQIAESGGDYENQTNRVRTLVKDIKGNPILLAASKNYKAIEEEKALEQQMRANGLTPLNFNRDRDNFTTVGPNGEIQEYKSGLEKGLNWRADAKEYIGKIESTIKEHNPEIDEKLSKSISYDMLKTGRTEMITDPMTRKRVEQVIDEFMQSNTGGNQFVRWTKFNNPEADERKAAFDLLHGVAQEQIFSKPYTDYKVLGEKGQKTGNNGGGDGLFGGLGGTIVVNEPKLDPSGKVVVDDGLDPLDNIINQKDDYSSPNRSTYAFAYKSTLSNLITNPDKAISGIARELYDIDSKKQRILSKNNTFQNNISNKDIKDNFIQTLEAFKMAGNSFAPKEMATIKQMYGKTLFKGMDDKQIEEVVNVFGKEKQILKKASKSFGDTNFENLFESEVEPAVGTVGIPMAQPNYMALPAELANMYKRAAETNLSNFDFIGEIDNADIDKPAEIIAIGKDVVGGGKGIPFQLKYKTKSGEEKTILATPKENSYGNQLLQSFSGLFGGDLPNKDTYKNVPILKTGKEYRIQELMDMNGRPNVKTEDKITKVQDGVYAIKDKNNRIFTVGESYSSIDLNNPAIAHNLAKQAIANGLTTETEIAPDGKTINIFLLNKILPSLKKKPAYYDSKYDILNQYN